MDVTPMSLQMVVPHSTEVGHMQHNLNQAGAVQQDFETLRQKTDAELKQKQVRNKDAAEEGRIKDDPERRNRGGYSRSGHRSRQEKEKVDPAMASLAVDPSRGQHLDISF